MFKKILLALTAAVLVLGLAACGASQETAEKQPEVITEANAADNKDTTGKDTAADNAAEETTSEAAAVNTDNKDTAAADDTALPGSTVIKETETTTEQEGTVRPDKKLDVTWTGTVAADGDGLVLRSGPDSAKTQIDIVPDGTSLEIQAEQDGWGYTTYRDQFGWVSLDFLTKE